MEIGKLIVIEGACDSVGKSTQSEYLIKRLEKDGKRVFNHHFPTYDENGIAVDPEVRKLLDKDDPAYHNIFFQKHIVLHMKQIKYLLMIEKQYGKKDLNQYLIIQIIIYYLIDILLQVLFINHLKCLIQKI